MAYGTIKADQITHAGAGGSDVDTAVSLIANKEGTAVTSTGESGTTKFLRADGDGTCSWQVPPDTNTQLTLIDEDDMASNDATKPPSQQSVKAYVDTKAPTANPTFTGTVNAAALTLSGNLTVGGTTTTVSSTTIEVADKNLELGKVSSPDDTTADAGGITLKGASDKEIKWSNTTDAWTTSEHFHVPDNKKLLIGGAYGSNGSHDLEIYHNGTKNLIESDAGTNTEIWSDTFFVKSVTGGGEAILKGSLNGSVEAYYDNVKKFETTATGVTVTGTVTDSIGDVRTLGNNVTAGTPTLAATDAGKYVYANGNVTIPASTFAQGQMVTIINYSGSSISIIGTAITLYNTADAATGNRTLASRGMATILFHSSSEAYISGAGLT